MNNPLSTGSFPPFHCFPSSLLGKRNQDSRWLEALLPTERPGRPFPGETAWTYRRYFEAIKGVMTGANYALLLEAARSQSGTSLTLSEIKGIEIYAEKHGNWYHPAKMVLRTADGATAFVMNIALHERGRAAMVEEVKALEYLGSKYAYPWIPRLHAFRPSGTEEGEKEVSLFLADWFEGYHEFHLSGDQDAGKPKLILWDGEAVPTYLSACQAGEVYRLMAGILTAYYDPLTYEQIFPWHQGAGDFVARVNGGKVDVRLISVRRYGALADPADMGPAEALLFFFLNLSIRIRLDRLDGIGELSWVGEDCLPLTWQGFLEELGNKEKKDIMPAGAVEICREEWSRISEEDLVERFLALLGSYDPGAPDHRVIEKNLASHLCRVYDLLKGKP
jgi:hypothetical protein